MASKGRYVEGTDGSDSAFRMSVKERYRELPVYKQSLKNLAPIFVVFYAGVASLFYFQRSTAVAGQRLSTVDNIHVGCLAGVFLPLVATYAAQRNRVGFLVVYAVLCGLFAAYFLYAGTGRGLTLLQNVGFRPLDAVAAAVFVVGCVIHLYGSYLARQILDRVQQQQRAATPKAKKST